MADDDYTLMTTESMALVLNDDGCCVRHPTVRLKQVDKNGDVFLKEACPTCQSEFASSQTALLQKRREIASRLQELQNVPAGEEEESKSEEESVDSSSPALPARPTTTPLNTDHLTLESLAAHMLHIQQMQDILMFQKDKEVAELKKKVEEQQSLIMEKQVEIAILKERMSTQKNDMEKELKLIKKAVAMDRERRGGIPAEAPRNQDITIQQLHVHKIPSSETSPAAVHDAAAMAVQQHMDQQTGDRVVVVKNMSPTSSSNKKATATSASTSSDDKTPDTSNMGAAAMMGGAAAITTAGVIAATSTKPEDEPVTMAGAVAAAAPPSKDDLSRPDEGGEEVEYGMQGEDVEYMPDQKVHAVATTKQDEEEEIASFIPEEGLLQSSGGEHINVKEMARQFSDSNEVEFVPGDGRHSPRFKPREKHVDGRHSPPRFQPEQQQVQSNDWNEPASYSPRSQPKEQQVQSIGTDDWNDLAYVPDKESTPKETLEYVTDGVGRQMEAREERELFDYANDKVVSPPPAFGNTYDQDDLVESEEEDEFDYDAAAPVDHAVGDLPPLTKKNTPSPYQLKPGPLTTPKAPPENPNDARKDPLEASMNSLKPPGSRLQAPSSGLPSMSELPEGYGSGVGPMSEVGIDINAPPMVPLEEQVTIASEINVSDRFTPHAIGPDDEGTVGVSTVGPTVASSTYGEDRVKVKDQLLLDPYGDKGIYTGQVLLSTGLPHGSGKMIYEDDGRTYDGDWRHGRWNGWGRATFSNGDAFEGFYKYDQRHGHGKYAWKDGRVYEGEFREDKRWGNGVFTWPDGARFEGAFVNGQREGKGSYTFSDGGNYTGMWVNGRYEGQGICRWADGRVYEGEWKAGMAHGIGTETYPDGRVRHSGKWVKDEPIR